MPPFACPNRLRALAPACARIVLAVLSLGVALLALDAGSASAWTLNVAQLDNATCGTNLQIGSNKTASSSNRPSFLLWGDGWAARYEAFVDGVSIGTFGADGYGNVCIYTTTPLAEGNHVLTGNELTPRLLTVTPLNFSVDTVPP